MHSDNSLGLLREVASKTTAATGWLRGQHRYGFAREGSTVRFWRAGLPIARRSLPVIEKEEYILALVGVPYYWFVVSKRDDLIATNFTYTSPVGII